jgi:hypothetical protein
MIPASTEIQTITHSAIAAERAMPTEKTLAMLPVSTEIQTITHSAIPAERAIPTEKICPTSIHTATP